MANNIPITTGSGSASVAGETVSGITYQQIEVYGGGGASVMTVNPDGSIKVSVIGTVAVTQSGAWSASVVGTQSGSVVAFQGGLFNTSIVSTVPSSVLVGASIFGALPGGNAVLGGVAASISGTVAVTESGTWNTSITSTVPSSVLVGASIFGALPGGNAVLGGVAASISGTVAVTQSGAWSASIIGGASVQGAASVGGTIDIPVNIGAKAVNAEQTTVANGNKAQLVTDLAGKIINLPYANPENFVSGVTSIVTGTASTSVFSAPAAGLRNYVTHLLVTNQQTSVTGAGTAVTFYDDGSGNAIYGGYAAAGGGGFSATILTPLRQVTSTFSISMKATTQASILVSYSGYKGA